ncbi:hypothetical protein BASA81_001241 [Batrachochytrium salamandrivorans]|nr:hypothetical protein BASA81_001241 [Batrachochytrium salamandrivorans]
MRRRSLDRGNPERSQVVRAVVERQRAPKFPLVFCLPLALVLFLLLPAVVLIPELPMGWFYVGLGLGLTIAVMATLVHLTRLMAQTSPKPIRQEEESREEESGEEKDNEEEEDDKEEEDNEEEEDDKEEEDNEEEEKKDEEPVRFRELGCRLERANTGEVFEMRLHQHFAIGFLLVHATWQWNNETELEEKTEETETFEFAPNAIKRFEQLFEEKTGNKWHLQYLFVPHHNKFNLVKLL